jgi:hypothetical protein
MQPGIVESMVFHRNNIVFRGNTIGSVTSKKGPASESDAIRRYRFVLFSSEHMITRGDTTCSGTSKR